jgi:hypothetical protein
MRSQFKYLSLAVFLLAFLMSGCGGVATPMNSTNSNAVANTANANTGNPLETKKAEPEKVTNNAPTLTPVFKAYCDAWVKNDEAALRKVYSQSTIKFFEDQMKKEKAKSLTKFLESTDKVSGNPCEVTNEKIEGDKAQALIRSNKYPNGIEIVFVKENGEWKMTNESPALNLKSNSN